MRVSVLCCIVVLVLVVLLSASCASQPTWYGVETDAGSYTWTRAAGARFYINATVLGSLIICLLVQVFKVVRNPVKKDAFGKDLTLKDQLIGLAAGILFIAIAGLLLWNNIDQNFGSGSYSLNSEGVTVVSDIEETSSVQWMNITSCNYFSRKLDGEKWRQGTSTWEKGHLQRGITLTDSDNKRVDLLIEDDWYDTSISGYVSELVLGSYGSVFALEEETRLKEAIGRYLPENVKQKMSAETADFLNTRSDGMK